MVLGGNGMLGFGVLRALECARYQNVIYSTRSGIAIPEFPKFSVLDFDAETASLEKIFSNLEKGDYIINCIGVIKPHITDDNAKQRRNAVLINGLFPDELARVAEECGVRVIQIATDCVYSGMKGSYVESDPFDATDVYGKTKSLGEVPSDSMMHLRVSIIGPENGRSTSLFEWVRNQNENAEIFGFTDHEWNGVTTYHFGKICLGIVKSELFRPGVFHVVPASRVSKYELVSAIAKRANRFDIRITPKESGNPIDRTLETHNPEFNRAVWEAAGYKDTPSVWQMVQELPI